MPRDGLSQYAPPPGTNGITNYTIESTKYNGFVADVTQDLNLPRPIVAGGTGANNAHDAMVALSGEIAKQGDIRNFDTFAWANGSFYSTAGATAGPPSGGTTVNRFAGIYYANADDTYATVEARDQTTGLSYVRIKTAGSWGLWTQTAGFASQLDAAYVNVGGDTMTGNLVVPSVFATGYIQAGAGGATGTYYFGNTGTKYLSYDGANFSLTGGPLITSHPIYGASNITAGNATPTGYYYFGNTGTKSLSYDGTNFNFSGGGTNVLDLTSFGNVAARAGVFAGTASATVGTYNFGNNGTKYLTYDGTSFNLVGGNGLYSNGSVLSANPGGTGGAVAQFIANGGSGAAGGAYFQLMKNGGANWTLSHYSSIYGGANLSSDLVLYNSAVGAAFQYNYADNRFTTNGAAYKPGGGSWADSSDARIKNELGNYTRGLAEIAALRPIYFTFKGNDTSEAPSHARGAMGEEELAKIAELPVVVPYPNSSHKTAAENATKYAGLIAQEVELVIPEMVTRRSAYIDGEAVDDLRDLDTTPLIFALINAVKELKAEVDALKARR